MKRLLMRLIGRLSPFDIRKALVQTGATPLEADLIQAMCLRLRVGENGMRLLAQCRATGRVKADDLNAICEWAPEVLADPISTRQAVRQAPILWPDFLGHLQV